MADLTIKDVRAKFPQYSDLSDDQLAKGLHKKFYSDMPLDQFYAKIGLGGATQPDAPMAVDPASPANPEDTGGFDRALVDAMTVPTPPRTEGPRPIAPLAPTSAPAMVQAPAGQPDALPQVGAPAAPFRRDTSAFQPPAAPKRGPIDTGKKTQHGRTLWQDENGELYSERSVTVQGKDGRWYNVPTVGADGSIVDPDMMTRRAENWPEMKDMVTGQPLEAFNSLEEAEAAARARSDGMDIGAPAAPPVDEYGRAPGQTFLVDPASPKYRGAPLAPPPPAMVETAMGLQPAPGAPAQTQPDWLTQALEAQVAGTTPAYDSLPEALVAEVGNAPERVMRGIEGNRLLQAEREIVSALEQLGTVKDPAVALAVVQEQKQKAGMAFEAANSDERLRLTNLLRDLSERERILTGLVQNPDVAAAAVQGNRDRLETNQRARNESQTTIDELTAAMTTTNVAPGLDQAVVSGVASVADMAPGLVTTLLTRNPLPMMVYLGGYSRGSTYADKRAEGVPSDKAVTASNLYALAEAIPEVVPLAVLLQRGTGALTKILGTGVTEATSEAVTSGLQTLIDMGVLDERMTWGEAMSAAGQAAAAGGVMGALMGGAGATVDAVGNAAQRRREAKGTPADPTATPPVVTPQPAPPQAETTPPVAGQPPVVAPEAAPVAPEAELVAAMTGREAPPQPQAPAATDDVTVMDEVENDADGNPVPTGRKVAVNAATGHVTVVGDDEAAGQPAGAPGGATRDAGKQPQVAAPVVGAEPVPAADAQDDLLAAMGAAPAQNGQNGQNAQNAQTDGSAKNQPRNVEFLDETDIQRVETDAKTMQYKAGGDETGVTERLRGITEWKPERAGMSLIYEYADGRRVVADGHQRLGLAKRLAAEGKPIQLPATILRETDGVTPEEARVAAALKNIAEGSGTAIDAAKVLRQTDQTPQELGLPPNSALVRDANGLRNLSDTAFGMVINGRASERDGGIVGRVVTEKAAQENILALLTKLAPANAFQAESIARQAASEVVTETQTSLFGDEEVAANLYLERAKVLDFALKRIRDDVKTFKTLVDRAETVTGAGNVLDTEANEGRLASDAKIKDYLASQANVKGPISDALQAAARRIKAGDRIGAVTDEFLQAVSRSVEEGGQDRAPSGESGGNPRPESQPEGLIDGYDPSPAAVQAVIDRNPGGFWKSRAAVMELEKVKPYTDGRVGVQMRLRLWIDGKRAASEHTSYITPYAKDGKLWINDGWGVERYKKWTELEPTERPGGDLFAPAADSESDVEGDLLLAMGAPPTRKPEKPSTERKPLSQAPAQRQPKRDLFDQGDNSQPGERQTDIEDLIAEKEEADPTEAYLARSRDIVRGFTRADDPEAPHMSVVNTEQGRKLVDELARAKTDAERRKAADDYVLREGKRTGSEHAVILDVDGYLLAMVRGATTNVNFPASTYRAMAEGRAGYATHNHPSNRAISQADALVMNRGLPVVVALGHAGSRHEVRPTELFGKLSYQDVSDIFADAERATVDVMKAQFRDGKITQEKVNATYSEIITLSLARLGIFNYSGTSAATLKAEGANLDDYFPQILEAVGARIRRLGLDVADLGSEGGAGPAQGDEADAGAGGDGQGADQLPRRDPADDDGERRLPDEMIRRATEAAEWLDGQGYKDELRRLKQDIDRGYGFALKSMIETADAMKAAAASGETFPRPNENLVYSHDDVKPGDKFRLDLDKKGRVYAEFDALQIGPVHWVSSSSDQYPTTGGSSPLKSNIHATREDALAAQVARLRKRAEGMVKDKHLSAGDLSGARKTLAWLDSLDLDAPAPKADLIEAAPAKKPGKTSPAKSAKAPAPDKAYEGALDELFGKETDDVQRTGGDLERPGRDGAASDEVGGADVSAPGGRPGAGGQPRAGAPRGDDGQPGAGGGVPGDDAAPVGGGSDPDVPGPGGAGGKPARGGKRGSGAGGRKGGLPAGTPRAGTAQDAASAQPGSGTRRSDADRANDLKDLFKEPRALRGFREDAPPTVEARKYEAAATIFDEQLEGQDTASMSQQEVYVAMLRPLVAAGLDRETLRKMKPYVDRYLEERAAGRRVKPEPAPKPVEAEDRAAKQAKADRIRPVLADEANIRETLPLLLPEQQDDVLKVERRYAKPDGHGMMLTNGTGTGKTFSGMGVIKRFTRMGKGDILIVAPSDAVIAGWVRAGDALGVTVTPLADTKDMGKGVTITTYANLQQNDALAKRAWDLVVTDEAQNLSMNANGDSTGALDALRAITHRPQDLWRKSDMLHADDWAKLKTMKDGEAKTAFAGRLYTRRTAEVEKMAGQPRSKVLFLSATPFAYDKTMDYAEGYLFEYPPDGHIGNSRQGGREKFMVENFGYRIRYHKLTKPETAVDSAVFERQMHERLVREGVLSGRSLQIDVDYDRKFVVIADAVGEKIDAALNHISEMSYKHPDKGMQNAYRDLDRAVRKRFDYLSRMKLLEAIKAKAAIPDITKHLALGRKVVVFHDYNVGGGFSPFKGLEIGQDSPAYSALADLFVTLPETERLDFSGYLAPKTALMQAFGDRAREFNGTVPKKKRLEGLDLFNTDGSGVDLLVVQADAGGAGISMHDTTGGHQRVLINLGMPTKPTTTLQEEGRILRVGTVSNAPFRYYTIGTGWERQAFASRIAERSGTVENLALGNAARAIREGFIDAYMEAEAIEPSAADGVGGKERDRRAATTSPYDIAKTHYFGRAKMKGRRDQREGLDFYPTPEPLAFKMVEWAGIRPNERVLEPSAGDGSIARYMPEGIDLAMVEPSNDLGSRAQLRAPQGRHVASTFESYHLVNKHHVIVMNPPFGSGGKTAMDHLAKAMKHVRDGGRIVALVPTGPAADKRWDELWHSDDAKEFNWTADVSLPAVTFERAGTAVMSRILVLDRISSESERGSWGSSMGGTKRINMTGSERIEQFFDRLEGISVPARPAPKTDILEELEAEGQDATAPIAPVRVSAPIAADPGAFKLAQTRHAKLGMDLFVATAEQRVDKETYGLMLAVAKRHGGWYSAFRGNGAIPGFQFKSEDARKAFVEDMAKPVQGLEEPRGFERGFDEDDIEISAEQRQPDDQDARFAAQIMAELAQVDELFANPTATSTSIEGVFAQIDPSVRYLGDVARQDEMDEGSAFADRAEKLGAERMHLFRTVKDEDFFIYEGDGNVWMDVSQLSEGGAGNRIYAAVTDYAYNTDQVFIGDPEGLSDVALRRRTEAMLSSALKRGTTDHLYPHERQVDGDETLGVPPLKWTQGDVVGNLEALIEVSIANLVHHVPEIASARYDFATGTFRTGEGEPLTDETLDEWSAQSPGVRAAGAGRKTLKRGILLNTLSRAESSQRDGLLAQSLRQPGQLVRKGLRGTFYERVPPQMVRESRAATEEIARQMPALRAELNRLDLRRVRLHMDAGADWQARFHVTGDGAMEITIGGSLDPMKSLHHEVIHAFRTMNLFTPEEWRALELAATRGWIEKHDILTRYPDLTREEQIEEAIAEEFSEALEAKRAPKGSLLVHAFNKIARFLKAVRNVFQGAGFQTPEDIFGRVLAGEMAKRTAENTSRYALAYGRKQDQRLSTETDAFKRWFGKSKVVDAGGKPLVVYHGTGSGPFDVFRTSNDETAEGAAFFSVDEDVAMSFGQAAWESGGDDYSDGPVVMPVYLSVKNPLVLEVDDVMVLENGDRYHEFAKMTAAIERAKAAGHDGMHLRSIPDGGKTVDQWAVFSPNQIKSVDNRGTFDPTDARISYQRPRAVRPMTPQGRAHRNTGGGGPLFIPDRRVWEELTRAGLPIWQRLREGRAAASDAVDRARMVVQDRFLPVLRAQEAIMRASGRPIPKDQDAYIAETTFSGKVGRHLFEIDEDFTKPIIQMIAATNGQLTADDVGEWLYARHALERNARIASINLSMPDGGSGMTNDEANRILAAAAAGPHAKRLEAIGAKIDALRERILTLREDAGLITHAEAQMWRTMYRHYVPLKGFAETDHSEATLDVTGVGRRLNVRGPESRRALGRRSEAFNPLQAAFTQAQEASIRAEKNRVGQALYELARDFPSPALWSVKQPKQKQYYNRTTGLVETRVEDPRTMILEPNEMAVKLSGKEVRIVFHDDRLARAAGTIGADQMNGAIRALSMFSRFFSITRTMLNPEFMVTNAFRDFQTAEFNIQAFGGKDRNKIAVAMAKNWRKAFMGAMRGQQNKADTEWSKHYREFQKAGAQVSFWTMENPEAAKDDLDQRIRLARGPRAVRALKVLTSPRALFSMRDNAILDFIERTNMAVDNAIRLAAFVEARKLGWTTEDAAFLAKELTVNFNRRGEAGPTLNAFYPFFNAAVQGSVRTLKAISSKRVAMLVATAFASGAINDLINAALSEEGEDGEKYYDKIPDWRSQRNFHLVLWGTGQNAVSIPMPYGYNLFPYAGQQLGKVMRGVKDPGDAWGDVVMAAFGAFSPINGEDIYSTLTPTIGDPLLDMARNQNWTGDPIYPNDTFAEGFTPDSHMFFASATELSKWAAQTLNAMTGGDDLRAGAIDVSPETLDYLASFVVGSAGAFWGRSADFLAKTMQGQFEDIEARNVPFLRLLNSPVNQWQDRDRYYRFGAVVKDAEHDRKLYVASGRPVPQDVQRVADLYPALLAAERERRGKGEWNPNKEGSLAPREEVKVILDFNRKYIAVMGKQGE